MDVRAVSNYQEFVKVREMRILLYCILIENMKYLLCLSSPPQRKQDFYWTYPKVLAISVHDASTSRATSEVIRIRVEILWWAKIKRNLNTETVKKSMYNHLGENGKTLEKKKETLHVFRYWILFVFQAKWKVFFSCLFECSLKHNCEKGSASLGWILVAFIKTYSLSEQARASCHYDVIVEKLERRAQVLWNLQNICVRYNYQIALLYYFFASSFHCRTRIFIPCHQGNWFSSRLSTLVRRRNPEKANKTVLPLALVGSEMIMANSAISTVSYSIRTRKELLNRYT